jgi:subtilisin family serine protease
MLANLDGTYFYNNIAGEGVTAYILDTGIYLEHAEFEGRAVFGANFADDNDSDGNGHGTHCAGTVIGATVGLAKRATAVAVKVLDDAGQGSLISALNGIQFTLEDHQRRSEAEGKPAKSVANLSFGGPRSRVLNDALDRAARGGIVFALAAGNENQDACNTSPASAQEGLTVGAVDTRDRRAFFSNYGSCVDVFAPGVNIVSAGISSRTALQTYSGTSMAAPHVAGVATVMWSVHPEDSWEDVSSYVLQLATQGTVQDVKGPHNRLLWADYECTGPRNVTRPDVVFTMPPDKLQIFGFDWDIFTVMAAGGLFVVGFVGYVSCYCKVCWGKKGKAKLPVYHGDNSYRSEPTELTITTSASTLTPPISRTPDGVHYHRLSH